MSKLFFSILTVFAVTAFCSLAADAQTGRKSVSGAEVNGTFRHGFAGKYKGSASEIKIWALGGGKLKVGFDLIYPHLDGQGNMTANTGEGGGEATITGDTAVYESNEYGPCKITIKFVTPGTIKVSQDGTDANCGFGFNVTADGTYKKVSNKKPKFETH
jgi:hypothetical protein